ncbi:MAG: hypothetical protein JRN14_03235 [Nitrososphaerota archaeon]|jgi:hypothetical protein|nr:hypothetical protein [Nitrososphaerota archaeon]
MIFGARRGQSGAAGIAGIIVLVIGAFLFVAGIIPALSPGGAANIPLVAAGAIVMLVGGAILKFAD